MSIPEWLAVRIRECAVIGEHMWPSLPPDFVFDEKTPVLCRNCGAVATKKDLGINQL